ncbi:SOS response-associated peptidase [Micromonospora radicis]|uniref:Abasic site processing protein n=1 Tax=Micromonospora radicis TaxID=1894971 RepID=A0A418MQU7_9ACTN|nr:SOS response-associated peptidase [Micromonospora radicis]RIV35968.1 SOS response-associated peptidase [Micromonospora radicis]
MCGRYATTRSAGDLSGLFDSVDETGGGLGADYNVAPTDPVPLVRVSPHGHRALCLGRWGLVPPWSRSPAGAARMINARVETVATSRAYAPSFARRRCLVPADGWYEWVRQPGGRKQPYFMTPVDGSVLAFAGIWSLWEGPGGPLLTCSVLTTAALGELAEVHDRMPLLLPPKKWEPWLGAAEEPSRLLDPPPLEWLAGVEVRPVGPAVGDVRNDGPALTARVSLARPAESADPTLF